MLDRGYRKIWEPKECEQQKKKKPSIIHSLLADQVMSCVFLEVIAGNAEDYRVNITLR